jgi:hypothetical protein
MILSIKMIYKRTVSEAWRVRAEIHNGYATMSLTDALDRAKWLEAQAVQLGYLAYAT